MDSENIGGMDTEDIKQLMLELAEKYGYDLEDNYELMDLWKEMQGDHPELINLSAEDVYILRDGLIREMKDHNHPRT